MWLTPDIEDEDELFHYLFLVDRDDQGVDTMYDVSAAFRNFPARMAAERLTQQSDPFLRDLSSRYRIMDLRMRYNVRLTGIYKITTNFAITPDELESFLRSLTPEKLHTFLEEAKCEEHD